MSTEDREKVGKREKARHYQSHEDREGVGR